MRIVREQMLCIITPKWNGDLHTIALLESHLRVLLRRVKFVHFASLALLPAEGVESRASLLLEIVIDEGTSPLVALNRLAHHPLGVLWALYASHFPDLATLPVGQRNNALRDALMQQLSVADGGFVGPRDRYVAQIRQERFLYKAVRRLAPQIDPDRQQERSTYASSLARRVLRQRRFEWVNEPSPKSFWRAQNNGVKLFFMGLYATLGYAALWVVVGVLALLGKGWKWLFGGETWLFEAFDMGLRWGIDTMERGAIVLLAAVCLLVLYQYVFGLLGRLARQWNQWFAVLASQLDRPADAWSTRTTYVLGWLTIPPILALALAVVVYVLAGGQPVDHLVRWYLASPCGWGQTLAWFYAAVYMTVLAILLVGLRPARESSEDAQDDWAVRQLKAARRWFFRPSEVEVERAQRVHPTIENCEAHLVAGTAHMISLTDLRWPYAWSAFWTRLSLRLVTTLGYLFFTEGKLGDTPGIQFSHWHIVDGGRRLLFCANFDGTFGGYLDDFILGPSTGTTLFWRWTELRTRAAARCGHPDVQRSRRFPPTRLIVFRGVKCESQFKTYARESMLPHVFRFVAKDLTVEEKNRATGLRDALGGERTDAKDDLIMRALES